MCKFIRKLLVKKKLTSTEGESQIDIPSTSIEFYREKNTGPFMQSDDESPVSYRWYAKLFGVPKEDCEMIAGADIFLDTFWKYLRIKNSNYSDSMTLRIATEWNKQNPGKYIAHLRLIGSDSEGYFYECRYDGDMLFNNALMSRSENDEAFKLWICNCLDLVYYNAPEELFIF